MDSRTVLVVEDNPITCKLFRVTLEGGGYTVVHAGDGATALALFERHRPDLVVQDLGLPDMPGMSVVERLRELPGGAEIPIIAVTGFIPRLGNTLAVPGGFADYLFKPVEPALLLSTVETFLRLGGTDPAVMPNPRVLLVDDDPLQRKLLQRTLTERGFDVTTAADAEDALQRVAASQPDAIVSDVLMPGMDGFRLCLSMRRIPSLSKIPLVLLSSMYTEEGDRQLALEVGATALLQRSPDPVELEQVLRQALHGGPCPPPRISDVGQDHYVARVLRQLDRQVQTNASLASRLAAREAELNVLASLSGSLSDGVRTESLFEALLDRTLGSIELSRGALYLVQPDGSLLRTAAAGNWAGHSLPERLSPPGAIFDAMHEGEPVILSIQNVTDRATADGGSILVGPLANGPERLGAIWLSAASRELTPDWFGFIKGMGNYLAQVITTVRAISDARSAEHRFRGLLEAAPDGIVVIDQKGRIVLVNSEAERLFGYRRDELTGQPVELLMPPRFRQGHPSHLCGFFKTPRKRTLKLGQGVFGLRHDGTEFPAEIMISPLQTDEGTYGIAAIRDATERCREAASLAEQARISLFMADVASALTRDATMSDMLHGCTDAMVKHLDAAFARIWILNEPASMLELQSSSGMYTHITGGHQFIPMGQFKIGMIAQERKPHFTNAVIGDPHVPQQEWAKREGMVAFAGYPMVVGDELIGVMGMFSREPLSQSILDAMSATAKEIGLGIKRKKTEEALYRSEENFRQLAQNSREVFWILDLASGRIAYVSPAYERIWQRSCDSLYASPASWLAPIHPEDRERVRQATPSAERLTDMDHHYRIVRPDGSIRWIHDRTVLVRDASGKPYRVAGIAEDITDQKAIEDQFRQSQKMEAIGKLAGGVAHDFNNMLTVIVGYAELLRLRAASGSPLDKDVGNIKTAADRAAVLTRQLLAFSRQQVLEPKVLDMNQVVLGMEPMLRRLIGEDIQLIVQCGGSLGHVMADPGQLEQVIMNLVVNARDAMPNGGKLIIETGAVELRSGYVRTQEPVADGAYVFLAVSDTGCGMTRQVQAKIFEPFFTTKAAGQGTGLGLSTVYGIVKQSGGEIAVYSEVRQGTVFKVYLPRVQNEPALLQSSATSEAMRRGSETILIVEDEDLVRALAEESLGSNGYTVLTASDGDAAVALSNRHEGRIDLLLTDMVMPGMNGIELAAALAPSRHDMKVLYCSGYSDHAILNRHPHDGLTYLQKPYTPDRLSARVREVLDAGPRPAD